jgi:exopolysaccharide biosynthesis polyprenyl glycosylphosphotransferase
VPSAYAVATPSLASVSTVDRVETVELDRPVDLSADLLAVESGAHRAADAAEATTALVPGAQRQKWLVRYQAGLVVVDLLAAALAVLIALLSRFGMAHQAPFATPDSLVGLALPVVWVGMVALNRAYEGRFIGAGQAEFERLFRAFLWMTALVAFGSYITRSEIARGFILIALPLTLAFDLVFRYAARKRLHLLRARGSAMTSVLVIGASASIADFNAMLRRDRYAGLRVVGACLPSAADVTGPTSPDLDVPVLGDADSLLEALRVSGADTVVVLSSGEISPQKLRWISWQLEGTNASLVVAPGLMEVAGPRLHIQPVAGLPLLHVEQPRFDGFRRFLKGAVDRSVAIVAVGLLAPVLGALWLAVRMTSRGPGFFRQVRIGRDGREFTMLKFRSMYVDAEARKAELMDSNEAADGLLFKMRDDPRVTRIGAILRRYSLDELPQLINVITGRMSLVGPRPPLPAEVAQYGDDVRRRLLVKPGLTGLWQVSGRSDLSWEESVRLDLRYVENWSPALDLMILWKTAFAVLGKSGAY